MRKHLFRFNDKTQETESAIPSEWAASLRIEKPLKTDVIAIVWVYQINAGDSESSSELLKSKNR